MIILKQLTVENFRSVREVNLHFPLRGSILIQGPNEAGKSTLLESIYFALYGEPLAPTGIENSSAANRHFALTAPTLRTLDDLVSYNSTQASVTLVLSIGVAELRIIRSIKRGEGQQVTLYVHRLGMPEEAPLTDVSSANERIIAELGNIDGETLRNSCLFEQKGLSRLENLRGSERETATRKLLGLEKLTRLAEQFKVTEHDNQLLNESAERLRLAELQARIPELSTRLGHIEASLDAVSVSEDLAEISLQEAEIAEQELSLEQIQEKRHELKSAQARIAQLKQAEAILGEIIAAYDTIAEAQHELPEVERQIADLERRERDELSDLERRVHDLEDLSRSFGTLERLGADLLATVSMIKELEHELEEQKSAANEEELKELDAEIVQTRSQIEQIRQTQHELEEQRSRERPQLEARLSRLRNLSEQVTAFRQAQAQYARRIMQEGLAEEHNVQFAAVKKELRETEQELVLVEAEAQQTQQRADDTEKRWRQLSIRRQLEEWQRLKGLSQGLDEAERQVMAAHQQQEQLTFESRAARRTTTVRMGFLVACGTLTLLFGSLAAIEALHQSYILASIMGIITLASIAGVGLSLQNYSKARESEQIADQRMQQTVSQVSMMVAAREAARRMGGRQDAFLQVEHEIRSLGGTVPQSLQEVQRLLQQMPDQAESLADIQQQMTKLRTDALTARNQVNVTIEAVAALRKEYARLEEQQKREASDNASAANLAASSGKAGLEQIYRQITMLAAQESLATPAFDTLFILPSESVGTGSGVDGSGGPGPVLDEGAILPRDLSRGSPSVPLSGARSANIQPLQELDTLIASSIKDIERAMVAIDAKVEVLPDISNQLAVCQEALDALLARRRVVMERHERFQTYNLPRQIEQAREQQAALRDALRSLQDSLRQRVHLLGISFGQTAVHNAESTARKQLEALHITVGRKVELQDRYSKYTVSLKEHQEALSELYRRLAKFSSGLGSWIVPLNPFAEALVALRTRCQQELQEANEDDIQQQLAALRIQEGASRAKIELCHQEIEEACERIATMLAQHSRPTAKGYTFTDIVAVWPLVGDCSPQDRNRLREEHVAREQELRQLEQQELELSARLQVGDNKLDVEQAHMRMELQERSYQTKKLGGLMVNALRERVMRKMLPRTEYYMHQLVPLLTCGRYREVRLSADPEEGSISGGPLRLRVWESAAGEYLPKSVLSGGTADQLSLALRLAFTIAALPRELAVTPGFLLLDEPLSSLDRTHAQALVDLVTGEMLAQHFEQVLLMSHSSEFDPALFPYHIYMDGGQIVECNLPEEPAEINDGGMGVMNHDVPTEPVPASIPLL